MLSFILISMLFPFWISSVNAAVKITPSRFEFTLKPNNTRNIINGSFSVQGGSNETIRFRIYPENFDIAEDGSVITNSESSSENRFINNIRFNPAEFTLSPGQVQRIRFTIPDINDLTDGEHRIALFMEDVKTKEEVLPTYNENVSASIVIKTRAGLPIYINKGKTIKSGVIEKLSAERINGVYYSVLSIKSTGNSNIRISGNGQIICKKKLIKEFPLDQHVIQAGNTGKFKIILPVNDLELNEDYKFKLTLTYKDQNLATKYLINEVKLPLQTKGE
jgi:P pilus assembly chaperone PapD